MLFLFPIPTSFELKVFYFNLCTLLAILLLISGSDVRYALPYKIYDYLSVKKPILAVAPENSAVAEIMRQINCGRFASINSKDSILTNLRVMIEENSEYSFSGVEQYTWDKICHKYVEIIDNI